MLHDLSYCSLSLSTPAAPLTVDNVLTAVQGVHWRTLGEVILREQSIQDKVQKYPIIVYPMVDEIGKQYQSDDDRLHAVVRIWVQGAGKDKEPSWRHLIGRLDWGNITAVSDNIRHNAEPVKGESCDSICVSHNLLLCIYYEITPPYQKMDITC